VGGTVRKIEMIVNTASGSVGPNAPAEAQALLAEFGIKVRVRTPVGDTLTAELRAAVDAAPDLLVVLAGDGTARAAAEMCGPDGPLVAPLPGGTMNMLPHAIYGKVPWPDALKTILESGEEQRIGGGIVEGRTFLVAAILGAPALWAPAREAVRHGQLPLALRRARRAWRRAFSGRLRYALDLGARGKTEALTFLCPLASSALDNDAQMLEADVLDPAGAAEAFRLAFNALMGDWRRDPSVLATPCRRAKVWASGRIPAALDGEPVLLKSITEVDWRPAVARILGPPAVEAADIKQATVRRVGH
jgi:diacylglycerol kinase family enzyme